MLKTRIITAVILLAVLLPVLFFNYAPAFNAVVVAFLGAALWEASRLFKAPRPWLNAAALTAAFAYTFLLRDMNASSTFWMALGIMFWAMRFAPALKLGLPPIDSKGSHMLGFLYCIALISCFVAIVVLFRHSATYLLSAMAIVWVADIGAYFSGKAFGKRKLAPSISPGKSWEGAIGGGIAVLLLSVLSIMFSAGVPWLQDTFAVQLQAHKGWFVTVLLLVLITAASVVGDLFESMLKRRAGMKDSSNLLPGHGGVLDRIDALVPVLPMAALITAWMS
jgi:phosphatidate cytidylyltransferase